MSKRLTTSQFIERAIVTHGDRYDYSLVEYIGSRTNVIITCHMHGVFNQTPNNHLTGNGCPKCAGVATLTTIEFIEMANVIHGERYDYSKTHCTSYLKKLSITCRVHGEFHQNYENHLAGRGCRQCGTTSSVLMTRKTKEQFVIESNIVHGDKYDYSLVEYVNNRIEVEIKCKAHGSFMQKPVNHIRGSGCQKCATTCFDTSKTSCLYVLISECGSMMKIGVTGNFNRRIIELRCCTPFKFNIAESFVVDGSVAKTIEKSLHEISSRSCVQRFNGSTEWFEHDGGVIDVARTIFK